MTYLTYRQSDSTTTDAQKQRTNVILGVPLTMYHVDANFAALSNQLDDYCNKYGLGSTRSTTRSSIESLFGSNNANAINATGFYQTNQTANVPQSTANAPLLHIETTSDSISDVTGLQITGDVDDGGNQAVYFRTRLGSSTWNPWVSIISQTSLETTLNLLKQEVDQCVRVTGGTITGPLTTANTLTIKSSTNIISNTARRGAIPSTNSDDQISIYDASGVVNQSTLLGSIGLRQSVDSYSGIVLSAINPTGNNAVDSNELYVGWKQNDDGTYVPYTHAPTPVYEDDYQIATTGWVNAKFDDFVYENNAFTTNGGVISGDVVIDGTLDSRDISATTIEASNTIVARGSIATALEAGKGNVPSVNQPPYSQGFYITDATRELDGLHNGGSFTCTIDYLGNSTAAINAFCWNSDGELTRQYQSITVSVSQDGQTVTTSAPTPPQQSNDQSIATTRWVRETANEIASEIVNQYEVDHPWDLGTL